MRKAVLVKLKNKIVHGCNTVTEAEEWLVENTALENWDDVLFDVEDSAVSAFTQAGEGSITAVPEDAPANDRATLLALIRSLVEHDTPEAGVVESARELIKAEDTRAEYPLLTLFDEVVTAGREGVVDFCNSGEDVPVVSPEAVVGSVKEWGVRSTMHRPMRDADLIRLFRKQARQVTHGLGQVPLCFAVPGMKDLLDSLEQVVMVPNISSFGDDEAPYMMPFTVTYDEWMAGCRTITREEADTQIAARISGGS